MNSCCPKEALGCLKIDNTNRKGKTLSLGDMKMYHVGSGEKAILYSFDIFGFGSGRTYQICDYFALKGYQVFMPDFYLGKPYPNKPIESDVVDMIKGFPFDSAIVPLMKEKILPYMQENGVKEVAVMGTCWGAWNNFKLAGMSEMKDLIKCSISIHPSLKIEGMFDKSVEDMVKKVSIPQLVLPSTNELPRVKPKGELISIMAENCGFKNDPDVTSKDKENVDFSAPVMVNLFDKVNHGYFTRGEMSNPDIKEAVERSCWLVEGFLKVHL
jgi:dienelactone hydrolase